jgi:Ubiquitin carboxyl-terminal hydrolase
VEESKESSKKSKKKKKKGKGKKDEPPSPKESPAVSMQIFSPEKINELVEEKLILKGKEDEDLIEVPTEDIENLEIPYFAHGRHILYQPKREKTDFSSFGLSLDKLVDCFFEPEPLFSLSDSTYKCEKCNSARCVRKYWLFDLPPILTFTIKRFQHTTGGNFRKIDDHVEIPERLCLQKHTLVSGSHFDSPEEVKENQMLTYQLYGIVEHIGTMETGHYRAFVKHKGDWCIANDSSIKRASPEDVKRAKAYLVFYSRDEKN